MNEEIDQENYERFRVLIYNQAGIALGTSKHALVSARISKRLRALNLQNYEDYYQLLASGNDPQELVELLDVISTNTTSFFREASHFDQLKTILHDWYRQGKRQFRIWCAVASTGEEPYTLSLTCQEAIPLDQVDLRILATDISTRVLRHCQLGEYTTEKIEAIPVDYRQQYFEKSSNPNHFIVTDRLKKPLNFARMNLMETPYPMKGPFDIIFCRNVMIYFDRAGRQKFVDEAVRLLPVGGYLFTGHSESISGFHNQLKALMPSVYQRN